MIEIRDVVKTFDGFRALDGVTMTVPRGAVYGLVGPNGAGKSTLIRHLTGIYRPDSGTRQSTAYAVTIGYQLSQYDPATGDTTYANVNYTPLTDSTRTLAWLRAHGIEPLLEGDSIKYGGDADTQPAINTYETTDSSFGR